MTIDGAVHPDPAAIEADVQYAIQTARAYIHYLTADGLTLPGLRILEIGPGVHFGTPLILASYGARCTVADRFLAQWNPDYHLTFYRRLAEAWDGPTVAIDHVNQQQGYPADWLTCISAPAETLDGVPDDTFDLCISNAVLEHCSNVPAACRSLARVTTIGGLNSHQIDFRDHRDWDRPHEFLLIDDREFRTLCGDYPCWGNRWRFSDVRREFIISGFDVVRALRDTSVDATYLSDFLPRLRNSSSRWRDVLVDDLAYGGTRLVLRRVAFNPFNLLPRLISYL